MSSEGDNQRNLSIRLVAGAALIIAGVSLLVWLAVGAVIAPTVMGKKWVEPGVARGQTRPPGRVPEAVLDASPQIQQAYRFASNSRNRELLTSLSCYCGCMRGQGHRHLLDCYIKEQLPGNRVTYEFHALNCRKCLAEAWDAEGWQQEGKAIAEVKALINAKHGP